MALTGWRRLSEGKDGVDMSYVFIDIYLTYVSRYNNRIDNTVFPTSILRFTSPAPSIDRNRYICKLFQIHWFGVSESGSN